MSGPVVALTSARPNTRDEVEAATACIRHYAGDNADDILAALGLS
jgi:hypothetical protein